MVRQVPKEMLGIFVQEMQSYLPQIRGGIEAASLDPARAEELEQAYRLTHTMKGASSMVGLSALSHVTYYIEEVLEGAEKGLSTITEDTAVLLLETLDRIENYLGQLLSGAQDDRALVTDITVAFRRFRGLSADDDGSHVEKILRGAAISPLVSAGSPAPPRDDVPHLGQINTPDMGAPWNGDYAARAARLLDDLAAAVQAYEREPTPDGSETLCLRAAQLAGEAMETGHHAVAELACRFANLLEAIHAGQLAWDERITELLSVTIDALGQLARGTENEELAGLVQDLNAHFAGLEEGLGGASGFRDSSSDENGDNEAESWEGTWEDTTGWVDREPDESTSRTDNAALSRSTPSVAPVPLDDPGSIDPDLVEVFHLEADEHLAILSERLPHLESHPDDAGAVDDCRRSAHTLKGAAGAVGLKAITYLAGNMENLLDRFCESGAPPDSEALQALGATTETIKTLLAEFDRATMAETVNELAMWFARLLGQTASAADHAQRADEESGLIPATPPAANLPPDGIAMPTLAPFPSLPPVPALASMPALAEIPDPTRDSDGNELMETLPEVARVLAQLERDPESRVLLESARDAVETLAGATLRCGASKLIPITDRMARLARLIHSDRLQPNSETAQLLAASLETAQGLLGVEDPDEGMADAIQDLFKWFDSVTGRASADRAQPTAPSLPRPPENTLPAAPALSTLPVTIPTPAATIDPATLELDDPGSIAAELLEVYMSEAEDHLHNLHTRLSDLEKHPQDREVLQDVRRSAHTLKGAAGAVGLKAVTRLAHRMEDLLDLLYDGERPVTSETMQLLFESTDTLQDLTQNQYEPAAMRDTLAYLYAWFPRLLAASPPTVIEEVQEISAPLSSAGRAASMAPIATGALAPAPTPEIFAEPQNEEKIHPELLEVFMDEAEEHLRALHVGLGLLSRRHDDRAALQEVRRAAHTLKGAAGAVGLRSVTKLAHRAEDLLDRLYDGHQPVTAASVQLLFDSVDALQDLVGGRGDRAALQSRVASLYNRFTELLGGVVPGVQTSPAQAAPSPENPRSVPPTSAPAPRVASAVGANEESTEEPAADTRRDSETKLGQVLRVPLARLDELVRLGGELVINRTAFEQRMTGFVRLVDDLRQSIDRLRHVVTDLTTEYEASMLATDQIGRLPGLAISSHLSHEFDELEFDRYTQFHQLTRSLNESTNDINTVGGELSNVIGDFDTLLTRQGRLSRELQDRLMRARMVNLGTLATRLHRAVRNVANQEGKQVDLIIDGEQVELDKNVLEEMADPLLHLLRNGVDHGIETPAERRQRGKPERATIRLRAFYQGTQVVIQVSDDGRGMDSEKLRATAVRNGLVSSGEAQELSDEELRQYIFMPGFSTASKVSEVSGRGVGMDIVRTAVLRLKGSVVVDSTFGQGTTFTIRLPMTLAITRGLLVRAGNETFAIPIASIVQILRWERQKVERIGKNPIVRLSGKVYPLFRLHEVLKLPPRAEEESPMLPLLILSTGGRHVALTVDSILANREIVVKTLGTHLRHVHGLTGATLMGDGTVVPILNVDELFELVPTKVEQRGTPVSAPKRAASTQSFEALKVMVVDDSVSVRRVMSNLITNHGWVPMMAKDGQDALEVLQASPAPPDIVLLDIEMPRMDGYQLLAALRGQDTYRRLPVVMVTSRAGQKHRQKALDLGATEYVVKPFQDEVLVELVRRLARKSGSAVFA